MDKLAQRLAALKTGEFLLMLFVSDRAELGGFIQGRADVQGGQALGQLVHQGFDVRAVGKKTLGVGADLA